MDYTVHGHSPGQKTGVGSLSLLQGFNDLGIAYLTFFQIKSKNIFLEQIL